MNRFAAGILAAGVAAVLMPHAAAAQCEGGTTTAGFYTRGGSYVPGGCATTNPTTPGQLYPSGAQPFPSTNPAQGASRLPGQLYPSGLLPVNSSDLGPAPSFVSTNPLLNPGAAAVGTTLGPGVPLTNSLVGAAANAGLGSINAAGSQLTGLGAAAAVANGVGVESLLPGQGGAAAVDTSTATTGLSDQSPLTGIPGLNINRAVPSAIAVPASGAPTGLVGTGSVLGTGSNGAVNNVAGTTVPGVGGNAASVVTGVATNLTQGGTAYANGSLPTAPARTEPTFVSEQLNRVTVTYTGE